MFVFSMLLVVFSLFRDLRIIRWLFLAWAGVGALVAARGLVQFANKVSEAAALGRKFYDYYQPERITGFMSHWMTFSGQEMFVLLMLMAYLIWSPSARERGMWFSLLCLGAVFAGVLLGFTRTVWLAAAVAGLYLIWFWKRWLVAVAPVAMLIGFMVAPDSLRTRLTSISQAGDYQFRLLTWRTGLRMVKEHPLLGLGPEQVNIQFKEYLPPETPRPLPSGWYGHMHNIYLHYAAERGVPALLILLWMLFMMLTDFAKALRRLPPGRSDRRFVLHGAIAVIIATMIAGLFEHNLGDSEVLTMFLVVAACGYVAAEKEADLA
jgi:O-antigen ligase